MRALLVDLALVRMVETINITSSLNSETMWHKKGSKENPEKTPKKPQKKTLV